jgi:hypothetical protein
MDNTPLTARFAVFKVSSLSLYGAGSGGRDTGYGQDDFYRSLSES